MKQSKVITTLEEHLKKRNGKIGTPSRDAFEVKSKAFTFKQLLNSSSVIKK